MIIRRDTLEQALGELEAHTLQGASAIVISRRWWDSLSIRERESYQTRAERVSVDMRVDDSISNHFVEVRSGDEGPPLSTEHPM